MKKIGKVFYWIISIALKIFAVIAGVNLIFSCMADHKRGPLPENGKFYDWKFGRIFYRKRGYGAPVLLLHGFEPSHSSKDLESLSKYLADRHTVYSVDLLGFGFSDKPWITYTNFLYVQLIQDFIKNGAFGLLSEEDAYFWNLKVEGDTVYATMDANAVPEPSTWALLVLGVIGLLLRKRVRS